MSELEIQEITALFEQRDKARDIACHLEAENAHLTRIIQRIKAYADDIDQWPNNDMAVDLLNIIEARP